MGRACRATRPRRTCSPPATTSRPERDAADDLKGLGKPDISGGDEAKSAVNTLADQIKADSDAISNALSDVSTAGELVAAASAVSTTLLTLQSQVKNTLNELKAINADNGSLKDAFNGASNCKSLSS